MSQKVSTAGEGRVWLQPNGCNTPLRYAGCYGMGDVALPEGDITYIRCPSPAATNKWDIIGEVVGTPGNKTTSLEAPLDLVNYLLSVKCNFNIQYRMGKCNRPDDPAGYESMLAFEDARVTTRGVTGLNGRTADNNNEVLVTADITFREMYFVKNRTWQAVTVTAQTGATLKDVTFCDSPACASDCGVGSVGCQVGYVVTVGITGGGGEEIWKTVNGGGTWTRIQSPFTGVYDDMASIDCYNDIVIIANGTSAAEIARSSDGGDTWTIVDVGGAETVKSVFMLDSANVWLVGTGGYIWYSDDGGLTWTIQSAGAATTEDLNAVSFFDSDTGCAVGENGSIVYTTDGGTTWTVATSGVATGLNAVRCASELIWWVVGDSATMVSTMDKGETWTIKTWPGAGTDTLKAIAFVGCMFGFFGGITVGSAGVMYSTVDGGYSYRQETLPTNAGINAIYACDPNTVFAATNGTGKLLKTA